jgi:hypothetical protein
VSERGVKSSFVCQNSNIPPNNLGIVSFESYNTVCLEAQNLIISAMRKVTNLWCMRSARHSVTASACVRPRSDRVRPYKPRDFRALAPSVTGVLLYGVIGLVTRLIVMYEGCLVCRPSGSKTRARVSVEPPPPPSFSPPLPWYYPMNLKPFGLTHGF